MKMNTQKIKKDLRKFSVPDYDKGKMEETVHLAKRAYHEGQKTFRIGFWEFLTLQVHFISRAVWLSQAAILLLFLMLLRQSGLGAAGMQQMLLLLSSAAPLIAFAGFPEILKSVSHNMAEIEACTRFSLRRLVGARLFIIGMADLCCLSVILAVTAANSNASVFQLILYLFVPFNMTCCGCLTVFAHIKSGNDGYFCAAVCVLCMSVFSILSFHKEYYEAAATGVWLAMFLISLLYLAVETLHACRSLERFYNSKHETFSVKW